MAVQLTIEFETLLELVDQLKPSEKQLLLRHLQEILGQQMLINDERARTAPEDSISRSALYGDDKR